MLFEFQTLSVYLVLFIKNVIQFPTVSICVQIINSQRNLFKLKQLSVSKTGTSQGHETENSVIQANQSLCVPN